MTTQPASDRIFFYRDENGKKQDAEIHGPLLNDPEIDLYLTLAQIRDYVAEGNSFDDAVDLFANADLAVAVTAGRVTQEELMDALETADAELSSDAVD